MKTINLTSVVLLALGVAMFIIDRSTTPDPHIITVWGNIGIYSWIAAFVIGVGSVVMSLIEEK